MARKKMKVILQDDVPGLGLRYDVEEVALGYFRNYLLPEGLAMPATDKALKELDEMRSKIKKQRKEKVEQLRQKAKDLQGVTIQFEKKVSEGDKLYGSVSEDDIETRLAKKGFENIVIALPEPIKSVGSFEAEADFGEGITANLEVIVKSKGKADLGYLEDLEEDKNDDVAEKNESEEDSVPQPDSELSEEE